MTQGWYVWYEVSQLAQKRPTDDNNLYYYCTSCTTLEIRSVYPTQIQKLIIDTKFNQRNVSYFDSYSGYEVSRGYVLVLNNKSVVERKPHQRFSKELNVGINVCNFYN